jgi:hypothetical protein
MLAAAAVGVAAAVDAQEPEQPRRLRTRADLITAEEIRERAPEVTNVYEVIQRLRPRMLQIRPVGDLRGEARAAIQVYLDGVRLGDVEVLKTMSPSAVVEIQHLTGTEASVRYGLDHEAGAILVRTTRRGG